MAASSSLCLLLASSGWNRSAERVALSLLFSGNRRNPPMLTWWNSSPCNPISSRAALSTFWSSLVLSAFQHPGPASCLTVPRTILSEWTWSDQSLLACSKTPPECFFRTVDLYYYCALLYILHSNLIQFSFFVHSNPSVQMIVSVQRHCLIMFSVSVWPCLIIVQYSDPENVFQVFWSWYQKPSAKSINLIQVQDLPAFILA